VHISAGPAPVGCQHAESKCVNYTMPRFHSTPTVKWIKANKLAQFLPTVQLDHENAIRHRVNAFARKTFVMFLDGASPSELSKLKDRLDRHPLEYVIKQHFDYYKASTRMPDEMVSWEDCDTFNVYTAYEETIDRYGRYRY
jgi:hypothetical protein